MTDPDLSGIAPDLRDFAVPVEELAHLEGNPRRGDVEAVARSYARFGQRKPIVARRREDGSGEVIAGNHQLAAARSLGWSHIAVVWTDDDDATARAYALADNRTAELGGYDDEALLELLSSIEDDEELLLATGWRSENVEDLTKRLTPPDLEDLGEKYGEHDDEDLWPVVRVKVSPETYEAWSAWVLASGGDPAAALASLLAEAIIGGDG